jgi:hypothetical protein
MLNDQAPNDQKPLARRASEGWDKFSVFSFQYDQFEN